MAADRPGRERHVFATVLFAMLSARARRVRYGYYYAHIIYVYVIVLAFAFTALEVREIAEIDLSEICSDYQRRVGFPRVSRPAHDHCIGDYYYHYYYYYYTLHCLAYNTHIYNIRPLPPPLFVRLKRIVIIYLRIILLHSSFPMGPAAHTGPAPFSAFAVFKNCSRRGRAVC